jgi:transcriptional antiterminator Rof (Rho-off)
LSVIFFYFGMITLCVFKLVISTEMKPDEQVDADAVEANANSSPTRQRPIVCELSGEAKVKLDVILSLIEPCDRATYGERLRAGAKKLEVYSAIGTTVS